MEFFPRKGAAPGEKSIKTSGELMAGGVDVHALKKTI
jgi:hypothetical protein